MASPTFALSLLLLTLCLACNQADETSAPGARETGMYMDYKVWGEEGAETVTCLLQFREGRRGETTLLLEPPAGVLLDGVPLVADSARLTGAFYEVQRPLSEFAGAHTIVFKDNRGREYRQDFTFRPFTLTTAIAPRVRRGDLSLELEGLPPAAQVRVILTDTAFATEDINRLERVENGRLVIRREELQKTVAGPVTLQLFLEAEQPVKQAPAGGGGVLAITYGLQREFELTD